MKRAWWIVLLLAGCTGPGAEPADDAPVVVNDPRDYSYLNGTDAGWHVHDYWRGQDRLQVLDVDERVYFLLNGGSGPYMARFLPEEGTVIPLGARFVEVTVEYSAEQPVIAGTPELWVQTQNQSEPQRIDTIVSGQTITFEISIEDADLPHQVLSAWAFYFAVPVPDGQPTNPATGNIKSIAHHVQMEVEVVRGHEIPPFPGHPDLWGDVTELPLVTDASGSTVLWTGRPPECGFCSGGIYEVAPDAGVIVPFDATSVVVEMQHTADTLTSLRLLYHGADTRTFQRAPLESREGDLFRYVIPVGDAGDSPYADQSLWRFYFEFDGDGPYRGAWSLGAVAVR